jgi:G3E family GTPase
VVDARHLNKELNDSPEPAAQIAAADVIILNKTDLVAPTELDRLEARIRKMNGLAQIYRTERSQIDPRKILNLKARELGSAMPASEHHHHHDEEVGHDSHHSHDHDRDHDHEHDHHHHHHDEEVASFYLSEERPADLAKVEAWLSDIIKTMGDTLYRSKGILHIKGQPKRVVFQGVQTMFEAAPDRFWNPGEKRVSQMVFIGKDLDEKKIRTGFANCLIG